MFEIRKTTPRIDKSLAGIWVTKDERAMLRALATDRGFTSVADYFRALISEDIEQRGTPSVTDDKG